MGLVYTCTSYWCKKGKGGADSCIANVPKGMPDEGRLLKHLVTPSPEDTGVGHDQSSEEQFLTSVARTSAFYSCCSALFISRDCSHSRAFAEPGLAWIFDGINNPCLWCRTAVGLQGSLPVPGSQNCPLSPSQHCWHSHRCQLHPHTWSSFILPIWWESLNCTAPGAGRCNTGGHKQSCEREAGKNRTWEAGIMVWLVPYLWANHLACTGRVINIWVSSLSTLLKDTTTQNEVEGRISRCPAQDVFG